MFCLINAYSKMQAGLFLFEGCMSVSNMAQCGMSFDSTKAGLMTRHFFTLFLCMITAVILSGCGGGGSGKFSSSNAAGYHVTKPISCVPYARDVSGIGIHGDAHTWWAQAAGHYNRSNMPKVGAVFVLSKSSRLRYGHVSVVKRVINSRTIEVTHSNWGSDRASRSMIYERMRVEDVSPNNDWTRARFWNYHTNAYGSPYIASGFIYPS
tara:strand:+ start:35909 stop:36535 length:627 start_codon:yes stop_codon:yes gene_type:complete